VSRKSPYSLYSLDIASFTMGASYDQKDALGFINLTGLPIKVRALLEGGQSWPQPAFSRPSVERTP
jgi:argininosuccinate synthase